MLSGPIPVGPLGGLPEGVWGAGPGADGGLPGAVPAGVAAVGGRPEGGVPGLAPVGAGGVGLGFGLGLVPAGGFGPEGGLGAGAAGGGDGFLAVVDAVAMPSALYAPLFRRLLNG